MIRVLVTFVRSAFLNPLFHSPGRPLHQSISCDNLSRFKQNGNK
jgi:hypothetical protein